MSLGRISGAEITPRAQILSGRHGLMRARRLPILAPHLRLSRQNRGQRRRQRRPPMPPAPRRPGPAAQAARTAPRPDGLAAGIGPHQPVGQQPLVQHHAPFGVDVTHPPPRRVPRAPAGKANPHPPRSHPHPAPRPRPPIARPGTVVSPSRPTSRPARQFQHRSLPRAHSHRLHVLTQRPASRPGPPPPPQTRPGDRPPPTPPAPAPRPPRRGRPAGSRP